MSSEITVRLSRERLERSGDVAAPAERDDDGVLGDRGVHDFLHLGLIRRVHHHVDGALDAAGADADQVAQALAVAVHDTLHGIRRDEVLPDDAGERRQEGGGRAGVGEVELVEGGLLGLPGRREVEPDRVQHEGREAGLVLVVEPDALDAPAPPLHVLDVGHGLSPSGDGCASGSGLPGDALRIRGA